MEFVSVAIDSGIATVTLSRPPVNALTRQVLAEIVEAFDGFATRQDANVAIFRTTGDKAFIAGVDLNEIDQPPGDESPEAVIDSGLLAREAFRAIHECAVPVICAVDAAAIGGGLALAAVCDIIVASERAKFGATEINVGLLGASAHLVRMVGPYRAREMYFTGRLIDAEEMARYGALAAVVPSDQLDETVLGYARELVQKSPLALRLAKQAMNRTEYLPFDEGYRIEQDYTNRLRNLQDSGEARAAWREKRTPRWQWR